MALLENTTEGLNVVLNGFPWQPGDEAITFTIEHSSVLVPTLFLEREGVKPQVLELAAAEPAESILERLAAALTDRTRLVALSYIQYASGLRMPLAEITRLAHERGAQVLVDGAQAAGHINVDLSTLPLDYFSMPGQKWMLGPDGTGALFIRRDHLEHLQPRKVAGAAGHFNAEMGQLEKRKDTIRKFELTTASPALRAGLRASVRFIQAAGIAEIEARDRALAAQAKHELKAIRGVSLLSPESPEASCGLVSFRIEGVEPDAAVSTLWERRRLAARAVAGLGVIRVSLHFFNTEQEVEQLAAAVAELARQGAPSS
jgi:L-cysteine/cystine lyase